jgi:hypothetical protein
VQRASVSARPTSPVELGAALETRLLFGSALGAWHGLETLVGDRFAALDRQSAGPGRKPLFGAFAGRQFDSQVVGEALIQFVVVQDWTPDRPCAGRSSSVRRSPVARARRGLARSVDARGRAVRVRARNSCVERTTRRPGVEARPGDASRTGAYSGARAGSQRPSSAPEPSSVRGATTRTASKVQAGRASRYRCTHDGRRRNAEKAREREPSLVSSGRRLRRELLPSSRARAPF